MTDIPADAPRSEDGHYWWDGTAWQLIQQPDASSAAAPAAGTAPAATPASSSSDEPEAAAQVAPPVIAAEGVPGEEAIAPDVATA